MLLELAVILWFNHKTETEIFPVQYRKLQLRGSELNDGVTVRFRSIDIMKQKHKRTTAEQFLHNVTKTNTVSCAEAKLVLSGSWRATRSSRRE